MKRLTRLLLIVLALPAMLACELESLVWDIYLSGQSDALAAPAGTDDAPVTFTIEPGQSVAVIAGNLKARGLITDAELFRRYVQAEGLDAGIQAGTYTLRKTMTIPEIAQALQKAVAQEQQVTIPEGKRLEEVAALVSQQTSIAADAFMLLAQTGWSGTDLAQKYPILANAPISGTLEGFLFPDTYRLPMEATAYDLIDRMAANFARQLTPEIEQGFAAQNLTLYEGIVLASIVEREAVLASERAAIAAVYHNRLRDGWPLSADPTVQYALGYQAEEGSWWKRQLYFVDLEVVSPYNTYRTLGLPPAPIASPGIGAIQAAAYPDESAYYFFMVDCTKGDGSHVFAQTEEEHLINYNRCGGGQ